MAELLLVAFSASDAVGLAGFAQRTGWAYDLLLVSGSEAPEIGARKAMLAGCPEVPAADGLAKGIASLCGSYSHVAALSSMQSKDALARLAGVLDAPMVTDVIGVESESSFRRPVVAGSLIELVEVDGSPVLMTVRGSAFAAVAPKANGASESVAFPSESNVKVISRATHSGARPDLTQAKRIISGGRPLKDAETFERIIGSLADAMAGAAGATRAAVDSGIAPNELQVGQTGKIVAPDLYIAAGVSGSTQHVAGMKDSKTIVAINTDGDAPIFEVADLGLVGDLYEVLPQLQEKIKNR